MSDDGAVQSAPRAVQARGVRRRAAILDAALEEFARDGYRATIASVAAAAGITDAGLLYHFPTKEDLALAVIVHHDELGVGVLGAEVLDALDPLDGIRSLASWGDWMEQTPNLMALHVRVSAENLGADTPAARYFRVRYAGALSILTRLFERARESGLVRVRLDPEEEARAFIALLDGLRLQWFFTDGPVPLAPTVRAYVDGLLARLTSAG